MSTSAVSSSSAEQNKVYLRWTEFVPKDAKIADIFFTQITCKNEKIYTDQKGHPLLAKSKKYFLLSQELNQMITGQKELKMEISNIDSSNVEFVQSTIESDRVVIKLDDIWDSSKRVKKHFELSMKLGGKEYKSSPIQLRSNDKKEMANLEDYISCSREELLKEIQSSNSVEDWKILSQPLLYKLCSESFKNTKFCKEATEAINTFFQIYSFQQPLLGHLLGFARNLAYLDLSDLTALSQKDHCKLHAMQLSKDSQNCYKHLYFLNAHNIYTQSVWREQKDIILQLFLKLHSTDSDLKAYIKAIPFLEHQALMQFYTTYIISSFEN